MRAGRGLRTPRHASRVRAYDPLRRPSSGAQLRLHLDCLLHLGVSSDGPCSRHASKQASQGWCVWRWRGWRWQSWSQDSYIGLVILVLAYGLPLVIGFGQACLHQHRQHDLTRPTRHDPTEPQISDTGQPRFFTGKNEGPKRPQASIRAASWPNLAPIMRLSARNAQKHSNKKIQKFASVLSFKTEEIWMDSRMDAWTWKIHLEIQT